MVKVLRVCIIVVISMCVGIHELEICVSGLIVMI